MAGNQDDIVIGVSLDTKTIKTGVNRVVGDIDYITQAASRSFDALGKRIDKAIPTSVQARIQNMVGIGTKSTKEWTGALAQQGAELEKLRTKYNPIFAAVKQYQASVVDIQQAHRIGAISADEMTTAIQRERKATLDSIAAIKQRNGAVASMRTANSGPNRFNTANIAAQFQDIAVTSAMGMSPIQIALQQGTQLSAVLNEMGRGKDVVRGLGAAFASVVSPVSLVTIGVIAAGAALAQYVASAGDVKTADDIIKQHEENIKRLGPAYEQAIKEQQKYATESPAVVGISLRDDQKQALEKQFKDARDAVNRIFAATMAPNDSTSVADIFKPAEQAMATFFASVQDGAPKVAVFREEIGRLAETGKLTQGAAADLLKFTDAAYDSESRLGSVSGEVDRYAAAFGALQDAINRVSSAKARDEAQKLYEQFKDGKLSVDELRKALGDLSANAPNLQSHVEEILRLSKAAANAKAEIDGIWKGAPGREGRNMGPGLDPKSFNDRFGGNQDAIDALERQRKELEKKPKRTAEDRKAERDANAYRDLVKSAQDRIDQLQLEEQLVGKTGVAAETMRMKLELLQRAQDKGRNISASQREEIEKLADAYGKAAEKVAAMSLAEELQFERAQMFRSPTEQRVYGQLRSAGISPDSEYGQAIGNQIRLNEQLAEGKDLATDFAQGLANDLLNGVSAMDALANAAKNLGAKLIEIGTNQVINSLFSNLAGGLGGGSGFGTSYFPPAPGGFGLFDSGGYTGAGGKYQPAGIVHKGEYVVPKNIVDRIGVGNIERLMGGFASGGLVGGPRVPSIPAAANNNSPSFTFAPVIDARGADVAAVARLEQVVAKQQAEFSGRVVQTMRQAKSTRNWRGS